MNAMGTYHQNTNGRQYARMVLLCFLKYKEILYYSTGKQLLCRDNDEVGLNDHKWCDVVTVILSQKNAVIKRC